MQEPLSATVHPSHAHETVDPIFKIPLDAQLDYESKVIADLA
jgi:hypothetical protein